MTTVDKLGAALLLSLLVALLVAFFLYFRPAYRKGGWKEVKTSAYVPIAALALLYLIRTAENSDLEILKEAVDRVTR